MESNSFRSSSVLSDLSINIQDDAVKQSSPLSVSKSLKSSSSSSDNEIAEYDDQENKPPGSVESNKSSSSNDSFKFKKPLPRETMPNEDNTLNSLIDDLSHLKLGSTSAAEKRFSFGKWTTPLKKKTGSANENPAFSDAALFEKNSLSSTLNDEETVENTSATFLSNKSEKETSIGHNDDDVSEYYDCSDDENATGEQAHVSTADSSFHSVPEKEHFAASSVGNATFVIDDIESVNQASLAEINRTQGDDQAYILEKYLGEQDFKLQLSMSDVSFNTITGGIDFELGKRQSIYSQTETSVAGSLFSFERQEKPEFGFTEHQDANDVTIKPNQFIDAGLFANAPQTEEALFNLLSDHYVENETRSLFDTNPDENIFALGRLSKAGYIHMDTVEEEDALMQLSTRKSLLLQSMLSCDGDSNQNGANESEENNPTQMDSKVEAVNEITEPNENEMVTDSSLSSRHQQTNAVVIYHSADLKIPQENSNVDTNEAVEVKQTPAFEEAFIESNQSSLDELNQTTSPKGITTIDEIFTAMNMNSEKLNETADFFKKTSNPSSLNATIDTESIFDDSLSEKSNVIVDSEGTRDIIEHEFKQNNDLPKLNRTVDLEASQNFILEIEGQASFYQSPNITVNLESTQITGDDLVKQSQDTSKASLYLDLETAQTISDKTEIDNFSNVPDCDQNFEFDHNMSNLNLTSNVSITAIINEETGEEKSNEFFDSNSIPVINESLTEQCIESLKSLTVSSETREVASEKSPASKQLNEVVSSDSFPKTVIELREQCQELLTNRTVSFETTSEKSPYQETSIESIDSETSLASVINLAEQSQVSSMDIVANPEITFEKVGEESFDQEQFTELNNSDTVENPVEQASKLAVVIDEDINRSGDEKSNEYANSKPTSLINEGLDVLNKTPFRVIRTVSFNLDITQIINKESTNDQDDAESEKTADLGIMPMTDQYQESLESSSNDSSEGTHVNETKSEDITKSSDLSETVNPGIDETPHNDSFTPVLTSSEHNETINLNSTHVINENIAVDSDNLNSTNELEPKIIENTSMSITESSHLGDTVDMEVTQIFEENLNDSADLDQLNRTIDLKNSTASGLDPTVFIQEQSRLNETVNMEVTRVIEKNSDDSADLDLQNRTIDLKTSAAIGLDSTVSILEPSRLNETVDMEVTRVIEKNLDDPADLDLQNRTIDIKTSKGSELDSTVPILEPSRLNETVDMEVTRIIDKNPEDFIDYDHAKPGPSKLNETVDLNKSSPTYENTVPYTSEAVTLEYDADAHMKMEGNVTVMPIFSTESILKSSSGRLDVTSDDLTSEMIQTDDLSNIDMEIEVNEDPTAVSGNLPDDETSEEHEISYCSNSKSCDNTVIIHHSPVQRCNSPARFDKYAASMPEPASPIPPNSPTELSNKWQTQVDLSSVADNLECFTGRDSASNSSDEMDVTDPIDSNIAPEMLQMAKLPPGLNRSISNLESIPELNETDANDEQTTYKVNVEQETKDLNPLDTKNTVAAVNPGAILNQTSTSTCSNELSSTLTQTSPQPKTDSDLNDSTTTAALKNLNDSIFKTPITSKLPPRSDLSALNDSNFNADYGCARSASAKSTQSRQSLISPRVSFYKSSPPIYSPFTTPSRRHRLATPRALGDVPPSLLDMSIGCFENYTANQGGPSTIPLNDLNKTVDVDDEPRLEETKLLCIDDPSRKVNVKTQTHDTELFDLRAENATLKEDLKALIEVSQAMADEQAGLKSTLHALAQNENELKKTVQQLEDNNRILNNKYETLREYSNLLLARRNEELDEAENKIRILEAQLQEYTKKSKASSK